MSGGVLTCALIATASAALSVAFAARGERWVWILWHLISMAQAATAGALWR